MGRPRPVREVMALLGSSPLIAMPLDASNAGKNYGTGGDFTANSAPYVGARSASEFWARSANFPLKTDYLTNTVFGSNQTLLTFSCVCSFIVNVTSTEDITMFQFGDFSIQAGNGNDIDIKINIDLATISTVYDKTSWRTVLCCFVATSSDYGVLKYSFVDKYGVVQSASFTVAVYTGGVRNFRVATIGKPLFDRNRSISLCFFTTDYIDFSQEVNRLKFVDGLGYPLDLKKQIEAGVIPKPLFYLPFDDPSNLGKDASGNNNHFTVNGTVTAGADFSL